MTRNKIITGIGIIVGLVIVSGIAFACWQYHQNSEFTKEIECQKLGKYYYYVPEFNECFFDKRLTPHCISYPDDDWCKIW